MLGPNAYLHTAATQVTGPSLDFSEWCQLCEHQPIRSSEKLLVRILHKSKIELEVSKALPLLCGFWLIVHNAAGLQRHCGALSLIWDVGTAD